MAKKNKKTNNIIIRKKIWKKEDVNVSKNKNLENDENKNNLQTSLEKSDELKDEKSFKTKENLKRIKEKLKQKNQKRKEKTELRNKELDEIELVEEGKIALGGANEKLKNAMEAQNPKKKKKSTILNLCLLAVNIVFMVFIVKNMLPDLNGGFFEVIFSQGHKLWWLVGGVCAYLIFILVQVISYKILIKSLANIDSTKLAYDTAIVGRYYDNVTPMAVGGQPMQIVVLANHNVNPAVSTGIPLIKLVINTGVSAILALVFFIFGFQFFEVNTSFNSILILLLEVFGVIGLLISLIVAVFIFLVSSGKLITKSFISFVLRLGYKMKFVKNYRKTYRKIYSQVEEYKFSMKYLLSNKKILFQLLSLNIIENLAYALMPYFVVMAFVENITISPIMFLLLCVSKYYLCTMASCFIPLPGGTGMMEISFIVLFGMIVGDNIVWALLGYRFFSYYLILLHGFIHELIKIFKNISKNKKEKLLAVDETQEKSKNLSSSKSKIYNLVEVKNVEN